MREKMREAYGLLLKHGNSRIRYIKVYRNNIIVDKNGILEWLGHLMEKNKNKGVKKIFDNNPKGIRKQN